MIGPNIKLTNTESNAYTDINSTIHSNLSKTLPKLVYTEMAGQFRVPRLNPRDDYEKN